MSSLFGKTIAFLALAVASLALGYTAWQVRDLKASFARTAAGNESNLTEMMIALAHADGQLARVREAVELLGAGGLSDNPDRSDGVALEGKFAVALSAAQREVLQQELKKWAQQLQQQRDKSLAAVREGLEREMGRSVAQGNQQLNQQLSALVKENQGSLSRQLDELGTSLAKPAETPQDQTLESLERRLAAAVETVEAVMEAVESQGQALARRRQREDQRWDELDKRWRELSVALEEGMEATQRRYAEVAALLKEQGEGAPNPANATAPGRPGQGAPAPASDRAQRERLAEFCAEVPQSALCRDL